MSNTVDFIVGAHNVVSWTEKGEGQKRIPSGVLMDPRVQGRVPEGHVVSWRRHCDSTRFIRWVDRTSLSEH
ncbi:hypothetical protein RP20_CCG015192 [Aedes albopictus]|nr:hypothetical protein RP20_CCG015192 [Aedes albopictus]